MLCNRFSVRLMMNLAVILLFTYLAPAGVLNVLPMKPRAEAPITLEYRPEDRDKGLFGNGTDIHAVIYEFPDIEEQAVAQEVLLKQDKGVWKGTVTLGPSTVFAMVKVGNGRTYDNNGNRFWFVNIYEESGRIRRGSNYQAAMACIGNQPDNFRRLQDLDEALMYMEEESKAYTSNLLARVDLISLKVSVRMLQPEDVKAELQEIAAMSAPKTAADVLARMRVHQLLGDEAAAKFTLGEASSRVLDPIVRLRFEMMELQEQPAPENFLRNVTIRLAKPIPYQWKVRLLSTMIDMAGKNRLMHVLAQLLPTITNLPPSTVFEAVNYMGGYDTLRSVSLQLVNDAVVSIDKGQVERPPYFGPSEFTFRLARDKAALLFVKGAIENIEGKPEAIATLQAAIEVPDGEVQHEAYDILTKALLDKNRFKESLQWSEKAVKLGISSAGVINSYRSARLAMGADSLAIEKGIKELRKQSAPLAMERLLKERLGLPAIEGTFTTLEGKSVSIADWKGKVVLIDYWATWCGPCRASFPALQKLYEYYKSNPEVQIAIVNVWERDQDRVKVVRDFLSKNPTLTFPTFLDNTDAVVAKFGVTGIPTKFYLDKNGRIQFKEVGYLPEDQFLDVAKGKIDLLLKQ